MTSSNRSRRPRSSRTFIGTLVAIAFVVLTECDIEYSYFYPDITSIFSSLDGIYRRVLKSTSSRPSLTPDEIFDVAAPSVVFIKTFKKNSTHMVHISSGSGIIWDNKGHIVTNYHVMKSATSAEVTLYIPSTNNTTSNAITTTNQKKTYPIDEDDDTILDDDDTHDSLTYNASIIGADPHQDIAVLRIIATDDKTEPLSSLRPITLGRMKRQKIGHPAYAIGHPFGLDHSLTAGVISGKSRTIRSNHESRLLHGCIQTDAALNPGNSGGPLLDRHGRFIGLNYATASSTGTFAGVGFAIPVTRVKKSVTEIIDTGKVTRAALGIGMMRSEDAALKYGITRGVLVVDVSKDHTRLGLKGTLFYESGAIRSLGDVIVKMNKDEIESDQDLFLALDKHKPGDEVRLKVLRAVSVVGNQVGFMEETVVMTLVESTNVLESDDDEGEGEREGEREYLTMVATVPSKNLRRVTPGQKD